MKKLSEIEKEELHKERINDVIYMGKFIIMDMIIEKMKKCNKKKDFIDYAYLFLEIYVTKDGEKHE